MVPTDVAMAVPLVYSKDSSGLSRGWAPTTPRPRTSCTWLLLSEMIQWREMSWAAMVPVLRMVMVYSNTNRCFFSSDWSGTYCVLLLTVTSYLVPGIAFFRSGAQGQGLVVG